MKHFFSPISVVLRAILRTKFAIIRQVCAHRNTVSLGGQILILDKLTGPPHLKQLYRREADIKRF